MCVDCTARNSAAKRAKEQCAQRVVTTETRGRKRRVLGDADPNVQRKAPRLASNEPARWDMASQQTREQMRLKGRQRTRESLSTKQQCYACTNPLPWDGPSSILVHSIPLPNTTSSSSASFSTRSSYIRRGLDQYQCIPRIFE